MAYAYPINPDYTVSPTDHGKLLILGNTTLTDSAGAYRVTFYPDEDFDGSFAVTSRPTGPQASEDDVGFLECPYRRIYTDGVAQDYALVNDVLTGAWDILIPANQSAVALVVACTAGTGRLYKTAVRNGDVAASTVSLAMPSSTTGKVGVDSFAVSASFTRPADTTGYAAGDVMANSTTSASCLALTIPVAAYKGQKIRIDKLYLTTSQATCVAQVRTQWYSVPRASLPTPTPVDNALMATILANDPYFKGYYDLLPLSAEGGTNTAARSAFVNPQMEITCASTDTNLYCTLSTNTAFTPASAQTFTLFVSGVRF